VFSTHLDDMLVHLLRHPQSNAPEPAHRHDGVREVRHAECARQVLPQAGAEGVGPAAEGAVHRHALRRHAERGAAVPHARLRLLALSSRGYAHPRVPHGRLARSAASHPARGAGAHHAVGVPGEPRALTPTGADVYSSRAMCVRCAGCYGRQMRFQPCHVHGRSPSRQRSTVTSAERWPGALNRRARAARPSDGWV
jgi:hypothetical protein